MNKDSSNWNHRKWYGNRGSRRGGFRRGGGAWDTGNYGFQQPFNNYGGFRGENSGPNKFGDRNDFNQQWMNWPKRYSPGKRLSEKEIGVTEYVSDHKGFNGIIKARYSDFQVSEINENGEIAKLTNLEPPQPPGDETVDEDEDLLLSKYNVEILPMETWDNINKLVVSEESTDEKVKIDVTGMTKEQRTKIHDAVKKAFGQSIVGSTVTEDDRKFVQFEKYRVGVRIDNRVKWIWPGEYVYFIVYKENCDTMEAAMRIAERLRFNSKASMLGFAGTKDRRAKTSQWFSLRKVDPRRIAAATRGIPDILLGNYSFAPVPLKLGMLKGNMFRVALRDVHAEDSELEHAVSLLRERGFVNYYGLQRFGSRAKTPTYAIGLKLIQGNLIQAINGILEPRAGPLQPALEAYRAGAGAAAALRLLPPGAARLEARVLRALARRPRDLLGGINSLSRNTRLLYLHSYQSLVWNRAVSERLRRGGLRPMVGDLVPLLTESSPAEDLREELDTEDLDDTESNLEDISEESAPPEETQESTTENKSKEDKEVESKEIEKPKLPVKVLTEEDIESGKYTIFDIILPLPGSNIEYPPNMKDYYVELLKKDDLTTEMKHKIREFSMSGTYRRAVVRPGAVSWRSVRYSDPRCDLLPSDRDVLRERDATGECPDGKYKALLLTLSLPSSCYATMALRELLKVDTSCDNQALKNNYHEKKRKKNSKSENEEDSKKVETEEDSTESTAEKCKSENGEKRKLESESDEVEIKKVKKDNNQDGVDKSNE
ncbi:pseudouridylate synthase 7 homolog [Aphomia sociella]